MRDRLLKDPFDLTITLTHPERPGRPARMRARRTALRRIASSGVSGHWLVTGDLNTTSSSPLFRELVDRTGLRDSRAGFGRQPTWGFGERLPGPLPLPLPKWARLSVAIDHALHSPGLEVLDRSTLAIPGSDHRAVSVTLRPTSTAR
jgi:endonuclease/exonuclease/phosphatase (EEP) superfamily protein YafD